MYLERRLDLPARIIPRRLSDHPSTEFKLPLELRRLRVNHSPLLLPGEWRLQLLHDHRPPGALLGCSIRRLPGDEPLE